MEYAIIEAGGKQYKTSVGNILTVDNLDIKPGDTYTFDKVLLISGNGECKIGRPVIENAIVSGKVLDSIKGPKIRVAKFKAKARYRRVTGFRQQLTRVQITGISSKSIQDSPKEKAKAEKIEEKNQSLKS